MINQVALKNILSDLQEQQGEDEVSSNAFALDIPWTYPLKTVNVALTGRCNLRCPCCYKDLNGKEIPLDRMLYTIDRLHEAGWGTSLMLAGGEPLLYKGLFDVIKRARSYDMEVDVGTNGTLLQEANVDLLAESDVTAVYIGVDPGLVQDPDKDPRAYEKTIRAFGRLREKGVKSIANLITTKQNLDILPDMIDTLLREGANGINLLRPKPQKIGRWFEDTQLGWKEIKKLQLMYIDLRRQNIELELECALGMVFDGLAIETIIEHDPAPSCCAGIDYCSVEQDGTVLACTYLKGSQFTAGNILTDDISELWRDATVFKDLRAPRDYSGSCGSCYMQDQCGGCRAVALLPKDDLNQEDPDCPRSHETKSARLLRHSKFWGKLLINHMRGTKEPPPFRGVQKK